MKITEYNGLEVAVIGMAGRFPLAKDIQEFWANLKNGYESVQFLSKEELLEAGVSESTLNNENFVGINNRIEDRSYFDSNLFGFRQAEAEEMDPQMRVFIECVWQALENAGYNPYSYNKRIGLYAGASPNLLWELNSVLNKNEYVDDFSASFLRDSRFITSRLAFLLDLKGPVMFQYSACSTSLLTVYQAVNSILMGECNMAIAGGVCINSSPQIGYTYEEGMILSKDGHCRPFDNNASGTIGGEGAGVVILKKLEDAISDNDNILAVIKGGGISNDGKDKVGFTAPSENGQVNAIKMALAVADVEPDSVTYIETHGTATKLGDAIEIKALKTAYNRKDASCAIGSVKSNIGHLDAAAGIAGFIKTVLCLSHKQIPPSINFQSPNKELGLKESLFYVNQKLHDWNNEKYPLRAGISSFGIGGTNVHLIVENAPDNDCKREEHDYNLLLFSGQTREALNRNVEQFKNFCKKTESVNVSDAAYTLQVGRKHFRYRKGILVSGINDAINKLEDVDEAMKICGSAIQKVFLFTGQGSQYLNMGRELYEKNNFFKEIADECFDLATQYSSIDFKSVVFHNEGTNAGEYLINDTICTQPIVFIIEYSLCRLIMELGVQPDVMIGHSIGEYVAACISGVLYLDDAIRLVVKRGELTQATQKGSMLSVLGEEQVFVDIKNEFPNISLAAINSNQSSVFSGSSEEIDELVKFLEQKGTSHIKLNTSHAFHSHLLDDILEQFENEVKNVTINPINIPYISSLTGENMQYEDLISPKYWSNQLRQTVSFSKAVRNISSEIETCFIEIGANGILSSLIEENNLINEKNKVVSLLPLKKDANNDYSFFLNKISDIWGLGIEIKWKILHEGQKVGRIELPAYSFDKIKYPDTLDYKKVAQYGGKIVENNNAEPSDFLYMPSWEQQSLHVPNELNHDRKYNILVFKSSETCLEVLNDNLNRIADNLIFVNEGNEFERIDKNQYVINPSNKDHYLELLVSIASDGIIVEKVIHEWLVYINTEGLTNEIVDSALTKGVFSLMNLCKAIGSSNLSSLIELEVITNNIQNILGTDAKCPEKSTVLGAIKIIPLEYQNIKCRCIDVDLENGSFEGYRKAEMVIKELQSKIVSNQSAFRGEMKWAQKFKKIPNDIKVPQCIKKNDVCIIFGGLGGMAFSIAKHLVKELHSKVILVGRSEYLDANNCDNWILKNQGEKEIIQKLEEIQQLRKEGAEIDTVQASISKSEDVKSIINYCLKKYGRINGILNTTGLIDFGGVIQLRTTESVREVIEPKILGTLNVYRIIQDLDIEYFVVFSSIGNVLYQGKFGQVAYNVANEFLDAFVNYNQQEDKFKKIVINWCDWKDVGMSMKAIKNSSGELDKQAWSEFNRRALSPVEGNLIYERIVNIGLPRIVVSKLDLDKELETFNRVFAKADKLGEENYNEKVSSNGTTRIREKLSNEYVKPSSELELKMVAIWEKFFGCSGLGITDNYFQLGGDSLKALRLCSIMKKELGIDISIANLFEKETISGLLGRQESFKAIGLKKAMLKDSYRVSSAQSRIYIENELRDKSLVYNEMKVVSLEGTVSLDKLSTAFRKIVQRHEPLRTKFEMRGKHIFQTVCEDYRFDIEIIENSEGSTEEVIKSFIKPFDLSKAPLIRVGLVRQSDAKSLLLIDMHHIITDGFSVGILIEDFIKFYKGEDIPSLEYDFKDYAEWEIEQRDSSTFLSQKEYWLKEFSDFTPQLELNPDFSRNSSNPLKGDTYYFEIDENITQKLKGICEQNHTTPYVILLSIYNILLSKLLNSNDVTIGTVTSNRDLNEIRSIVGMFVNTLPLRNYPKSEMNFTQFLQAVKKCVVESFDNQLYQYEDLIDELNITRTGERKPLFDAVFSYVNFEEKKLELPDIKIAPFDYKLNVPKFDLLLIAQEGEGKIKCEFEYRTDLYKESTIQNFATYFTRIAELISSDENVQLSDIEVLPKGDKDRILEGFNQTDCTYEHNKTVLDLFKESAVKYPSKEALKFEHVSISFQELDAYTDQIAMELVEKGAVKGDLVAILLEPSEHLIISILSIIKSGAGFVAIDVDYPEERKKYILESCGAQIVISEGEQLMKNMEVIQQISFDNIIDLDSVEYDASTSYNLSGSTPEDTAYVLYTSGSTGKPKGVIISHGSLYNYISWANHEYIRGEECPMSLFTSISFDLTITSVFLPLISGNTLKVYRQEDEELLVERVVNDGHASVLKLTPAHLSILLMMGGSFRGIKRLILGGEQLEDQMAYQVYQKSKGELEIYNEYGPTEATVGCVFHKYKLEEQGLRNSVLIGRPVSNTKIYILDDLLEPVPYGSQGEIYIGGAQLFTRYLNDEAQTNAVLIENPFITGEKVYKTGDLARWLHDGNIEFQGRKDGQIKIKGYRIELEEIENLLLSYEMIDNCVVSVLDNKGGKYLAAYYVAEKELQKEDLQAFLRRFLPEYMIPLFYTQINSIPLTINAKVDYRALPDPVLETEDFVAPGNKLEEELMHIWSGVLGVKEEEIGVESNFFQMGGDSIKSIQLASKIYQLGYTVTISDIFNCPTIRSLSGVLKVIKAEEKIDQGTVEGLMSLSPIQEWFFANNYQEPHHYNQAVMLDFPEGVSKDEIKEIFEKIMLHHDALRMTFRVNNSNVEQYNQGENTSLNIEELDITNRTEAEKLSIYNRLQSSIDIEKGPLMKLGLYHAKGGSQLLIVVHHLVIDGVSWRILLEDIETLYGQKQNSQELSLPLKSDSYKTWIEKLEEYIESKSYQESKLYWDDFTKMIVENHIIEKTEGDNHIGLLANESIAFSKEETSHLLKDINEAYGTNIEDILLSGLLLAFERTNNVSQLLVDLEGHGREDIFEGIDISRTVGWFTSIYPIFLQSEKGCYSKTIKNVKEAIRRTPQKGLDYLLYKKLELNRNNSDSHISFNYLGQFDSDTSNKSYKLANEYGGNPKSLKNKRDYELELTGIITKGKLQVNINYSKKQYEKEQINSLINNFKFIIHDLIEHCKTQLNIGKQLTPSDLTYKSLSLDELDLIQDALSVQDIYPLSPMQEGMYYHFLLDSETNNYFEQISYDLIGNINIDKAKASLLALMNRYDILRTTFLNTNESRLLQVVLKDRPVDFSFIDIREEIQNASFSTVKEKYKELDKKRGFDLHKDTLIRITILRSGDDSYVFIWSFHHILMDGWCLSILINDFNEIYTSKLNGFDAKLPKAIPYSNYISWLERYDAESAKSYWSRYLEGYENLSSLPLKSTSVGLEKGLLATEELIIDSAQTLMLHEAAKKSGVTLNTLFQTAWGMLLSKYNNTHDVIFGSVVSGRPAELEGVDRMVGLFINTIPVRVQFTEQDRLSGIMQRIQSDFVQNVNYQNYPLSEIQAQSSLKNSLLDHIMIFENYPIQDEVEGGVYDREELEFEVANIQVFEQTNYEFIVVVIPGSEIKVKFDFNQAVYEPETIQRVKRHFKHTLNQIALGSNPLANELDILTKNEKEQLLHEFNETKVDYQKDKTVIDLFDEQVSQSPDKIALKYNEESFTYQQLNSMANTIAYNIRKAGVLPGSRLAMLFDEGFEPIVAILGILKAGCAYVPIDPDIPQERIIHQLSEANCSLLISNINSSEIFAKLNYNIPILNIKEILSKGYISEAINLKVEGDSLAYVIFTSGTTGLPKGVMINHKSLYNTLSWRNEAYNFKPDDNILLLSKYSFDSSIVSLFSPLSSGSTLVVMDSKDIVAPSVLADIIPQKEITCFLCVPALYSAILDILDTSKCGHLRKVTLAGDSVNRDLVVKSSNLLPQVELINEYGPTENSVVSSYARLRKEDFKITIGKPISNSKIFVVDRNNQLLPVGVYGELCVAGDGLAMGYLNNEKLTNEKFVNCQFIKQGRMYRTGDLARWLPDGSLEFGGRIDDQIKIRGFRIELSEIQNQMLMHPLIKDALIIVKGEEYNKHLVSYYVSESDLENQEIKQFLSRTLPTYMIPTVYMRLESIPLTRNGKVDRRSLPDLSLINEYTPPTSKLELKLSNLWEDVLEIDLEQISITSSFFEIGGHSISAISLINKIKTEFNITISLADLFEYSTIQSIASLILVQCPEYHEIADADEFVSIEI